MRIRSKSSWTYLMLILTCFFIPQVQAGWMDDLKNATGAINDAVTTTDNIKKDVENTADRVKKQISGTANTDDEVVGNETAESPIKVNTDNFVRAETAAQIDRFVKMAGGVNKWTHFRLPTPLDKQTVIRMNRDTLYSAALVDISKGATLTLPNPGKRYMSMMVLNEDQYVNKVFHKGGTYKLTMKEYDSPYVLLLGRTLVNPADPKDIKTANALQDQMKIKAVSSKPYSHPNYDQESYKATYKALLDLSAGIPDSQRMFGKKDEVSEVRHLLGAAFGWGGLPTYEAVYTTKNQSRPTGEFQLTVKDVPVDGFWSISIYNKDGYFEKNKFDSYSINSVTAKPNDNGSVTVNFGTNKNGKKNFLYVMDGWNYVVRLYQPYRVIQEGKWAFPEPRPVK